MSATVANGRYMTATNLVAKCIGGPDLDDDGYCGGPDDLFDANSGHNAVRHSSWAGATHPALQMDTDGDKVTDVRETYTSQCAGSATRATPGPLTTCAPFPSSTPGLGSPGYTLGADPAKSCAQTIGPTNGKDEGPWDNWGYDFNDDGQVNGQDLLVFAVPFTKTVDLGSVDVPGIVPLRVGIYRFDINNDGIVNGQDLLVLAPVFGKTCARRRESQRSASSKRIAKLGAGLGPHPACNKLARRQFNS